eukprot:TRINITY_DN67759_c5_g8_i1.p1 TRINITY_DN67759_c5_g8~~TRINITY_DN67759_c5_g8_i1.p1  ORF type:complete len:157 (+),score=20.01 TRINITY_DN67759_c5_g8_i1:165-635(+)
MDYGVGAVTVLGHVLPVRYIILGYGLLLVACALYGFLVAKEGNSLNIVLDASAWFSIVCFFLHFFYPRVAMVATLLGLIPMTIWFSKAFKRSRDVLNALMFGLTVIAAILVFTAFITSGSSSSEESEAVVEVGGTVANTNSPVVTAPYSLDEEAAV